MGWSSELQIEKQYSGVHKEKLDLLLVVAAIKLPPHMSLMVHDCRETWDRQRMTLRYGTRLSTTSLRRSNSVDAGHPDSCNCNCICTKKDQKLPSPIMELLNSSQ